MPVTSIRTLRADVDAPFAPSMKVFSRRETCTAAVVMPIIEAETDRGSISDETRQCSNSRISHYEDTRGEVRGQGKRKDSCAAPQPPTIMVSIILLCLGRI